MYNKILSVPTHFTQFSSHLNKMQKTVAFAQEKSPTGIKEMFAYVRTVESWNTNETLGCSFITGNVLPASTRDS